MISYLPATCLANDSRLCAPNCSFLHLPREFGILRTQDVILLLRSELLATTFSHMCSLNSNGCPKKYTKKKTGRKTSSYGLSFRGIWSEVRCKGHETQKSVIARRVCPRRIFPLVHFPISTPEISHGEREELKFNFRLSAG